MKIKKESLVVNTIPLNIFYFENKFHRPLIFFVHGYFGNKEDGSTFAKVLVNNGFVVVCLDAYLHGDRLANRLSNLTEDEYLYVMFEIVEKTALDIDLLIDYFKDDDRIDRDKIGLSGISMGGFTTFYELARQSKIKVAVSIIGLPSFYDFWIDYVSNFKDLNIKRLLKKKDTPQFREYISTLDPMNNLDKIDIPLLIINGIKDEDVPLTYSKKFYDILINRYQDKDLLKLSIHDVAHEWNGVMLQEAVSWFVRYLK